MGFIQGPRAPKSSSLDISRHKVKFERKSIVNSISMELP